jgi:hypothetical protein
MQVHAYGQAKSSGIRVRSPPTLKLIHWLMCYFETSGVTINQWRIYGGGGRWCDRPPLWRGLCWRRSGAAPPLAVIRGAVGGVWLVFEKELRSAVEKM